MSSEKERSQEGQHYLKRLRQPVRGKIVLAQIIALVSCSLVFIPYFALYLLGQNLLGAQSAWVLPLNDILLILFIGFSLRVLLYVIALTITHVADLKLRFHIREVLLERISAVPLQWLVKVGSGSIRKLIQDDATTVHTMVAHAPVDLLLAVANPLVLFGFSLWLDWRLALISVCTIPLYIGTYALCMRGMNEKTVIMDQKLKRIGTSMVEFVAGIAVVRAFGQAGKAHDNYQRAATDFTRFYKDWCNPMIFSASLSFVWISIPMLLLVNLGISYLILGLALEPVKLVVITIISLMLPENFLKVSTIMWNYQIAGAAALRIADALDQEILPQTDNPQEPEGTTVVFDHVSFGYTDTDTVLNDISLTLQPNTVTALIGPSGSGKSTLAALLARFQDPQKGRITIGGKDLRDLSQKTLYDTVSFVLQDAQLLDMTVAENIALGCPQASQEAIEQAARAAQVHDEIMALPQGYDTRVSLHTGVSGGQAQRIAIARALLKDCPILILDEATAMADPESEARIQQALSKLAQGRTVLVIAHRVASMVGADQIVVLKHGAIQACGTHEELQTNEHYQTLMRQKEVCHG